MADNFHQIYIHVVFAVSHRESAIGWEWANRLYKYIGGVLSRHNNTPIAINGMPDHLHVLFGLHPANSLSETIQQIKQSSSYWINHNHLAKSRFRWQAGYAAFSYSRSQIGSVKSYIMNQQQHHLKQQFVDEFREMLEKFGEDFSNKQMPIPIQ